MVIAYTIKQNYIYSRFFFPELITLFCISQESENSDKTLESHRHPSSSFVDSIMVAMMKTQEPETESPKVSGVLVFGACVVLLESSSNPA